MIYQSLLLTVLITLNIFGINARASTEVPTKCSYLSRTDARGLFSSLPKEMIGAATCSEENKELSSLLIVRLKTPDERSVAAAVIEIAKIQHPMNESAEVTWKSNQPLANRQLMVTTLVAKTDHSNAQVMLHYAFVAKANDGSFLVFIHSAPEKETHALRQSLEATNRELRTPAFLKLITG